jgi:hypothetical protein
MPTPQECVGGLLFSEQHTEGEMIMTTIQRITHHKADDGRIEHTFELKGLSETAIDVVKRVRVLRRYTDSTGFKTTRSQNELIQSLDGKDLVDALFLLERDLEVLHHRPSTTQARTR